MEGIPNQNMNNDNNGAYTMDTGSQNINNANMYQENMNNPNMNNSNIHQGVQDNNQNYNTNTNTNSTNGFGNFDPVDVDNNKIMAVLSYILPFIPYFVEKDSKWVRFHSTQGMNLFIVSIIMAIVLGIVSFIIGLIPILGVIIGFLLSIVSFALGVGILVLDIMGIISVCKGEAKELPIIKEIRIVKE